MLEHQALFFARADRLGDPFEGSYSQVNVAMRPTLYKDLFPDGGYEAFDKNVSEFTRAMPRYMMINCWSMASHESAAMWRLYSKEYDGLAIRTNVNSFLKSFVCDEDIYVGKVLYTDYKSAFIPENNFILPFLHKRNNYAYESEIRAMTIKLPSNGQPDLSLDVYDSGIYCGVDLSLLIQEVVVTPYAEQWFVNLVKSIANRYSLDIPIRLSALANPPTWG